MDESQYIPKPEQPISEIYDELYFELKDLTNLLRSEPELSSLADGLAVTMRINRDSAKNGEVHEKIAKVAKDNTEMIKNLKHSLSNDMEGVSAKLYEFSREWEHARINS